MISTDTPANVIEGAGRPQRVKAILRGPRAAALVGLLLYLGASGLVLVAGGHSGLALWHAAGMVVAGWACFDERRFARTVGDFLPLFLTPLLYGELPVLIATLGSSYHDALIQGWEAALFGTQPARVFATTVPNVAVSETLHAGYLAYY